MVKVFVNDQEISIQKGCTIFQACDQAGIEIPRFCYHERLSIAGNCRMCLVEVEKSPKPVASCAMPVMEGMKIKTNTPLVKKAREGVLEFLLINHPLDCPICDQGGECDLQDLTMVYGSDRGRFHEYKRSVEDKNLGPLIKTIMTRCIHCTRCVRFAEEIAGVEDLGTVGRGRETEISTYIEKTFDSEVSGNVIDLCPVGALTSKPYAFTSRPWELRSTETIDVTDAIGSNIRIDIRGSSIMRVLPRLNEWVNEEWISDKTRFSYDGLQRQRIHYPMKRVENEYQTITWEEALSFLAHQLQIFGFGRLLGILGQQVDVESAFAMKELFSRLGNSNLYFEGAAHSHFLKDEVNSQYLLGYSLPDLEDVGACLLIGVHPRYEATLLNLRLRKRSLKGNFKIASLGPPVDLTYEVEDLGQDLATLIEILEGRHSFCKSLARTSRPLVILGQSILKREDGQEMLRCLQKLGRQLGCTNFCHVVHSYAGLNGFQELGIFGEGLKKSLDSQRENHVVLCLESDEPHSLREDDFLVYIGHHGDRYASQAHLILPSAAYTEKEESLYMNLEGRSQKTKLALYPPAEARESWKIVRAISEMLGVPLDFQSKEELGHKINSSISPHLWSGQGKKPSMVSLPSQWPHDWKYQFQSFPFQHDITQENYYVTDPICRASSTMAKCVKAKVLRKH